MDPFDLTGRVALVTGGSRGLGREMALAFARFGADVMIASRKQDACDITADEIQRATGRRALGRACHVGRWNELQGLVDAAYEHFGPVDVLVNNAGMSPLYPSVEAVSEELWDKVLGVNLKRPFRLTALIGSRMAHGSGGSIINISSWAPPDAGMRRSSRHAVCSPLTLASAVGLDVLRDGGNAVDAAIATNLALAVAYPHMCGVGGDLLAMVWADGALAGLNSSGRLPAAAALPPEGVPERGIGSATVPGAPAGWRALAERFGTRPLRALAAPAIRLAREGVARAPGLARMTEWSRAVLDAEAARIFLV